MTIYLKVYKLVLRLIITLFNEFDILEANYLATSISEQKRKYQNYHVNIKPLFGIWNIDAGEQLWK